MHIAQLQVEIGSGFLVPISVPVSWQCVTAPGFYIFVKHIIVCRHVSASHGNPRFRQLFTSLGVNNRSARRATPRRCGGRDCNSQVARHLAAVAASYHGSYLRTKLTAFIASQRRVRSSSRHSNCSRVLICRGLLGYMCISTNLSYPIAFADYRTILGLILWSSLFLFLSFYLFIWCHLLD